MDHPQQPLPRQPRHRQRRQPAKAGTPGGGSGGAIYNDGNTMTLRVAGTLIEDNRSNHEGGSAIFFVSNDRSGDVRIVDSVLRNNTRRRVLHLSGHLLPGSSITFTRSTVR